MLRPVVSGCSGLIEPTWNEGTEAEIASRAVAFPVYKLNNKDISWSQHKYLEGYLGQVVTKFKEGTPGRKNIFVDPPLHFDD